MIATYPATIEAAFAALGPEQLELYRATTAPTPVEVTEATLVRDRIPPGNPATGSRAQAASPPASPRTNSMNAAAAAERCRSRRQTRKTGSRTGGSRRRVSTGGPSRRVIEAGSTAAPKPSETRQRIR